jgi:hypothetical protein
MIPMSTSKSGQRQKQSHRQSPPTWLELDVRNSLHKSKKIDEKLNKNSSQRSSHSNASSASRLLIKKITSFRRHDVNKTKDKEQEYGSKDERRLQNGTVNITMEYPIGKEERGMNCDGERHLRKKIIKKKPSVNTVLSDGDRRMLLKLKETEKKLNKILSTVKQIEHDIVYRPTLQLTENIDCNSNSLIEKEPIGCMNSTSRKNKVLPTVKEIEHDIVYRPPLQLTTNIGCDSNSLIEKELFGCMNSTSKKEAMTLTRNEKQEQEEIEYSREKRKKNKVVKNTNTNGRRRCRFGSTSDNHEHKYPQSLLPVNNDEHENYDEAKSSSNKQRLRFTAKMRMPMAVKFLKSFRTTNPMSSDENNTKKLNKNTRGNLKKRKAHQQPNKGMISPPPVSSNSCTTTSTTNTESYKGNKEKVEQPHHVKMIPLEKIDGTEWNKISPDDIVRSLQDRQQSLQAEAARAHLFRSTNPISSNKNNTKKINNSTRSNLKKKTAGHTTTSTTNTDSNNKGKKKIVKQPHHVNMIPLEKIGGTEWNKISPTDIVRSLRNAERSHQAEAAEAQHERVDPYNAPRVPSGFIYRNGKRTTTYSRTSSPPPPQSRFRYADDNNNKQANTTPTPRRRSRRRRRHSLHSNTSVLPNKPPLTPSSKSTCNSHYQQQQQQHVHANHPALQQCMIPLSPPPSQSRLRYSDDNNDNNNNNNGSQASTPTPRIYRNGKRITTNSRTSSPSPSLLPPPPPQSRLHHSFDSDNYYNYNYDNNNNQANTTPTPRRNGRRRRRHSLDVSGRHSLDVSGLLSKSTSAIEYEILHLL